MRLFVSLLALVFVCVAPAKADYIIKSNRGGVIYNFINDLNEIAASGERVRIEGPCLSACTLILRLPRDRICVGPSAVLGFHAAWNDEGGRHVTSQLGTNVLRQMYPVAIKRWIARHGGLTPKMIYLTGTALHALYPACPHDDAAYRAEAFEGLQGAPAPLFMPPIKLNYVR